MKFLVTVFVLLVTVTYICASDPYDNPTDNEFADFEEFEVDDDDTVNVGKKEKESSPIDLDAFNRDEEAEDDVLVEDEDSEFEHFQDEEEFEGFSDDKETGKEQEPKITITKVPLHFRANWDSYWLEMLMVAGLIVYFMNFFIGKTKNTKLANAWLATHKSLLDDNFTLVGDDGKLESESPGLIKESENMFTLWCSGRTCCEGMLVELKFIKRQDLVALIAGMMRPAMDQVHITVTMNKEDMDSFVFCIASKKTAAHFVKDIADLSVYCPERRPGDKLGLPANFSVMSEISEATSAMLDSRVIAVFNKYTSMIDYIHFSDQYSGVKQPEDSGSLKLPETQRVLLFGFNVPPLKGQSPTDVMEQLKPLLVLVFYFMEKVKRYRLSKEGKTKADKNRARVEEAFMKSTHAARAEAAAARREERRRQEKERVLADSDPERQRRWEEREQKRQLKKKAPKMKQLKVKAL